MRLYEAMGPGPRNQRRFGRQHRGGACCARPQGRRSSARSPTTSSGKIYRHDIEAQGIDFLVPARNDVGATARSR